jgi:4-hydroxy-tetrahydrodipicolinate synthase
MLSDVCKAFFAGRTEDAEDLFDIFLPVLRHEQQIGIGLAIRKEILRRRGAIKSAAVRMPGPRFDKEDHEELDRLIRRLEQRLAATRGTSEIAA